METLALVILACMLVAAVYGILCAIWQLDPRDGLRYMGLTLLIVLAVVALAAATVAATILTVTMLAITVPLKLLARAVDALSLYIRKHHDKA